MTTNGILLAEQAAGAAATPACAGSTSASTRSREETFRTIARRDGLDRVLAGIAAAQRVGFEKIRLNAVAIRGHHRAGDRAAGAVCPRARAWKCGSSSSCRSMPTATGSTTRCCPARRSARSSNSAIGPLVPVDARRPEPAGDRLTRSPTAAARIGFINPVTQPFCGDCNRLRLTAEGQVRNCLFSTVEWDARALLRGGGTDEELAELVRDVRRSPRRPGHGIDSPEFIRPQRAMYELGG